MDERLRRLERQAALGDREAELRWREECKRIGLYFRDRQPDEILSEAEEIQEDYDEIFWHAKGPRHFSWNPACPCCGDWSKWSAKLTQDHHTWGHRWGGQNSKRKTLRTHRNAKHKSKNYRLRD